MKYEACRFVKIKNYSTELRKRIRKYELRRFRVIRKRVCACIGRIFECKGRVCGCKGRVCECDYVAFFSQVYLCYFFFAGFLSQIFFSKPITHASGDSAQTCGRVRSGKMVLVKNVFAFSLYPFFLHMLMCSF
jgi:hypothetical protein